MTSKQERVQDAKAAIQHVVDLAVAADPKAQQTDWSVDCGIPVRRGLQKGVLYVSRSDYSRLSIVAHNTDQLYASIQFPADGWAQDHKRHRYMSLRMRVDDDAPVELDTLVNGKSSSRMTVFGDESPRQQGFLTMGQVTELLERRARGRSLGTRLRKTWRFVRGKII